MNLRSHKIQNSAWLLIWLMIFLFVPIKAQAQDFIIDGETIELESGAYYYNDVSVINGGTLIFNGEVRLNCSNLTIAGGGVLTHSASVSDVSLTVNNNLTVMPGSKIDVSSRGYPSSSGPGAGTDPRGGGGGGYGGAGGQGYGSNSGAAGGPAYGSVTQPTDLGSGGGAGGRIAIYYQSSTYTGEITAYGGTGCQHGEYGTIYIEDINIGPVTGSVLQVPANEEFSMEQSKEQTFQVSFSNRSDAAHTATVEVLNQNATIGVTLGTANPVVLEPSEVKPIDITVNTLIAQVGIYNVQLKITGDVGKTIYSNITIHVTATGVTAVPELNLTTRDISFSNTNPDPNQTVTVITRVHDTGTAPASNVSVKVFDLDTLLGETTTYSIASRSVASASIPVTFASEGTHLIRVELDAEGAIQELDETNNETCKILKVGTATEMRGNILVTGSLPSSAVVGSLFKVTGHAVYEIYVNDVRYTNYVVKGGTVQITVKNDIGDGWMYSDIYTDTNGNFLKYVQAPPSPGPYQIIITVIDNTFTGTRTLPFTVVPELTETPPPPPTTTGSGSWVSGGGGSAEYTWVWSDPPVHEPVPEKDLYIHSQDIVFSKDNPVHNEEITIFATVHFWATSTDIIAQDIPVNFYVTHPGYPRMLIGQTMIERITVGSPDFGARYTFATWKNTAEGIYIVEAEIDPSYTEDNVMKIRQPGRSSSDSCKMSMVPYPVRCLISGVSLVV